MVSPAVPYSNFRYSDRIFVLAENTMQELRQLSLPMTINSDEEVEILTGDAAGQDSDVETVTIRRICTNCMKCLR